VLLIVALPVEAVAKRWDTPAVPETCEIPTEAAARPRATLAVPEKTDPPVIVADKLRDVWSVLETVALQAAALLSARQT
jgi:hypothetical protein